MASSPEVLTAIKWVLKNCGMDDDDKNKLRKKFGIKNPVNEPNIFFKTQPGTEERKEEVQEIISNFDGCVEETISFKSPLDDDGRECDESQQELEEILNTAKEGVYHECTKRGESNNWNCAKYKHKILDAKGKKLIAFWTQDC